MRTSVAKKMEVVHNCVLTPMTVTTVDVAKVSKLMENSAVALVSLSYVLPGTHIQGTALN